MFTGFQKRSRNDCRQASTLFAAVALLCLVLLALLTFVQVIHTHAVNSDADHCPLCIVMHTAAPVTSAAALVALVQVAMAAPVLEEGRLCRHWQAKLFIRPPPAWF